MLDFSSWPENTFRAYGGANGQKKCLMHESQPYMVKIMGDNAKAMSAVSEYLGCHIYQLLGIPAQETLLGHYKGFWAVACKDFCALGERLNEYAWIRNTIVATSQSGKGKELVPVLLSLEEQNVLPSEELKRRFWDMFVIDALLGNFDRHTGNFGIVVNEMQQSRRLAPVYDCGSCLFPAPTDTQLQVILADEKEMLRRVYEFPASAYHDEHNQKIKYHELLASNQYSECTEALLRLKPIMDEILPKVYALIDELPPEIHTARKKFYRTMLALRKEKIIDFAYSQVHQQILDDTTSHMLKEVHRRESFLTSSDFGTGITREYKKLFSKVSTLGFFNANDLPHVRDTRMDAVIALVMLKAGMYGKRSIMTAIEELSPAAVGRKNYGSKILVRAKDPIIADLAKEIFGKNIAKGFAR